MKVSPIAAVVLVYMFVLEVGTLAAFAFWGSRLNVWTAIGVPVLFFVLWSMFLSPKASIPVMSYPVRSVFKFVVFALASAALYDSGLNVLAAAMIVTSLADVAIIMWMRLDVLVPANGHRIKLQ